MLFRSDGQKSPAPPAESAAVAPAPPGALPGNPIATEAPDGIMPENWAMIAASNKKILEEKELKISQEKSKKS